jgi:hypothetical protein
MYERKPEDMKPLKYKVGDKIMGFAQGLAFEMVVAGEVINTRQSTSHLNDNEYNVKLLECIRVPGQPDRKDFWIDEHEARPFVQEVFDKAFSAWTERDNHLRISRELYTSVQQVLYPERFITVIYQKETK